MANYKALNIDQLQSVKESIQNELLESMSLTDNAVFSKFGINVLTDVENQDRQFGYNGYQSIARAYKPGDTLAAKLGEFSERVLKVTPFWTRVPDNIQNYREKGPISIAGVSSNGIQAPQSEFQMRKLAAAFGDQVRMNLWHGDRTAEENTTKTAYGLYDGFLTKIKAAATAATPEISTALGNMIAVDPLTTGNVVDNYEALYEFWGKLSAYMQGYDKIYFAVSPNAKRRILSGYMTKYQNLQLDASKNAANPYFFEMPNVELVSDTSLGTGDGVIAYTPGLLDYGTDLTRNGEPDGAYIDLYKSPDDSNVLIYQMQAAAGTRIKAFDSAHFACSANVWTAFTKPVLTEGVLINGTSNTSGGTDNEGA